MFTTIHPLRFLLTGSHAVCPCCLTRVDVTPFSRLSSHDDAATGATCSGSRMRLRAATSVLLNMSSPSVREGVRSHAVSA